MVWLVNDNNVLVVSRAGGNTTGATPLQVIMATCVQLVMIGKQFAQELGLSAINLERCLFTIDT